MPLVRSQVVQTVRQADTPKDFCVNDVYHQIDDGGFNPAVDYQNHANEIRDLFAGGKAGPGSTFQTYASRGILVKVYDMADPKPRIIKATASHTPTAWQVAALAPRELACCVSFYGDNPGIPSQRGRIYIGPFLASGVTEVVDPSIRAPLLDLGHGLFDVGGENVAHVVYSPTKLSHTVVHNYWVNDLWDHMSSREQAEAARDRLKP